MKLVFVPLKDVFKECKGKRQFSIKKDAYRRFSSVSNEMQIGIKKIAALYQAAATIGRRFTIHHGYAVVINKNVVAGDDFTIRHGVTIGNRGADNMACPHIGNGVELGANVIILGDITLGNNVTVGAGSVVLDSVPDNALVVGEKARVKVIK